VEFFKLLLWRHCHRLLITLNTLWLLGVVAAQMLVVAVLAVTDQAQVLP
jgi:hypothetical protein